MFQGPTQNGFGFLIPKPLYRLRHMIKYLQLQLFLVEGATGLVIRRDGLLLFVRLWKPQAAAATTAYGIQMIIVLPKAGVLGRLRLVVWQTSKWPGTLRLALNPTH